MAFRTGARAVAVALALCGMWICDPARGQAPAPTAPPEPPPARTVEWREPPGGSNVGRAAAYKGEVDEQGIDFVMPGNVVFGRSGIHLSGEAGKTLHLEVRNQLSQGWDRQLSTDSNGVAELVFRTEGEALVRIRSASGKAPYQVMFFAGRELPVHRTMPNTIVPMKTYLETLGEPPAKPKETPATLPHKTSETPIVLWVIAALLAALVILAAVFLFRKNNSSKA